MKSIAVFFLSVVMVAAISCKSKDTNSGDHPATAKEYYQKVLEIEESISEPLLKAEAEIKARSDKNNFAGIAASAKVMEDTLDVKIKALKNIPAVGNGAEDFKTMAVRYFEYIKSIYTAYKDIGEAKDEEQREGAVKKMADLINAQEDIMTNLNNAQIKFAADNGFSLDEF